MHAIVKWRPSVRTSVRLRSDVAGPLPISRDVVRRLAASRPGAVELTLRHDLPIGQGFGMSAAGALATGLATASALGLPRQRAIETAHLADLFGGGGLGGVSAILGDGLEVRERPGIPPWGKVQHFPCVGRLFLIVAGGPLPSPRLLRDPRFLQRVQQAAAPGLRRLGSRPSLRHFLDEAERFTDALRVGPAGVLRRIKRIRSTNVSVAQSMLGRSLFAMPRTPRARTELVSRLEATRLPAVEVAISTRGAIALP
ncbi:MAG: hypothetical protein L3J97_04950 [Thermoplasmata archaeon]|nr:hypothetical protein [Thermoplasmata archaeon]